MRSEKFNCYEPLIKLVEEKAAAWGVNKGSVYLAGAHHLLTRIESREELMSILQDALSLYGFTAWNKNDKDERTEPDQATFQLRQVHLFGKEYDRDE